MRHPGRSDGKDPVTIREVAAAAGVSTATVSRALAHPDRVSAALVDRVRVAAGALRYVPNASARALSSLQSGIVGVTVPDVARYAVALSSMMESLDNAGLAVLVRQGAAGAPGFAGRDVEAEVALDFGEVNLVRAAQAFAALARGADVGFVGEGGRWFDALRKCLACREVDLTRMTPARAPRILACADDRVAIRSLAACRRLGLPVPGQVAVVGFGDLPFAGAAAPSLTTVRLPEEDVGRAAASRLLAMRAGKVPVPVELAAKLVIRASTGSVFHVKRPSEAEAWEVRTKPI